VSYKKKGKAQKRKVVQKTGEKPAPSSSGKEKRKDITIKIGGLKKKSPKTHRKSRPRIELKRQVWFKKWGGVHVTLVTKGGRARGKIPLDKHAG